VVAEAADATVALAMPTAAGNNESTAPATEHQSHR
jgi:hypothetical protein